MGSTITIDFHGDPLAAILDDRGGVLVPLRPLVLGMGLDWSAQLKRVKRDAILGPAVVMMATDPVSVTDTGPALVCLPLDLVPGFLFTVDAARVAEAARPKVLAYKRECFRVLAEACLKPDAPPPRMRARPLGEMPTGESRKLVAECRSTFGVVQARELWFALGLPRVPSMYERAGQLSLFPGEYSRQPADGAQS